MVSRTKKALATMAAFAACTGIAAPAAQAATLRQLPPERPAISRYDVNDVLSPYGPHGVCEGFHGARERCWQQRPDGTWQPLIAFSLGAVSGSSQTAIYPIWEDPASLNQIWENIAP